MPLIFSFEEWHRQNELDFELKFRVDFSDLQIRIFKDRFSGGGKLYTQISKMLW